MNRWGYGESPNIVGDRPASVFPDEEEIQREVALRSPVVRACVDQWRMGRCTWEEAMLLAVRELVNACNMLSEQLLEMIQIAGPNGGKPIMLSPELVEQLRQQMQTTRLVPDRKAR